MKMYFEYKGYIIDMANITDIERYDDEYAIRLYLKDGDIVTINCDN